MSFLSQLKNVRQAQQKWLAVLLDPDKEELGEAFDQKIENLSKSCNIFLVGGSLLSSDRLNALVIRIKTLSDLPVVLFPGSGHQLSKEADAMLYLSLISGRNPELLIGEHVRTAHHVKSLGIETVPTGYMLVESGVCTTAQYISQTQPIPRAKPEIAAATAMAGEMLGLQMLYLDGGSGADMPVPTSMIKAVASQTDLPLIVGGGIRTAKALSEAWSAGATMVVVGTAIELDPTFIEELKSVRDITSN